MNRRFIIASGGTGGHFYPGFALGKNCGNKAVPYFLSSAKMIRRPKSWKTTTCIIKRLILQVCRVPLTRYATFVLSSNFLNLCGRCAA